MSDQYVGEIRYFPYLRGAPSGWLACDGSTQQVQAYQLLFALIGTTYGGDGNTTFGLPDLRGRVAIGANPGSGYTLGQTLGTETVTLTSTQLPAHNHVMQASLNAAGSPGTDPTGQVFANGATVYATGTANATLAPTAIGPAGQNLPHNNCAPTLPIGAYICWDGTYPPRND